MSNENIYRIVAWVGFAMLFSGCWMLAPAAALIVGGVLLLALAVVAIDPEGGDDE